MLFGLFDWLALRQTPRHGDQVLPEGKVPVSERLTSDAAVADRATKLARELYGSRAVVRAKTVQTPGENPRLHWWVDQGRPGAVEAVAAESLQLLADRLDLTARQRAAKLSKQEPKKMNAAASAATTEAGERLLTSVQAASYLGVTRGVVTAWVARGWLKAVKRPGGKGPHGFTYGYTRQALDEAIQTHKYTPHRVVKKRRASSATQTQKTEASSTHPQMNGHVSARVRKIADVLSRTVGLPGLRVTVSPRQVYQAALERGLEVLEKEIKS